MTKLFVSRIHAWCWLGLALLALPVASFAQPVTGVGVESISIHDPVNGGVMPGYVFYPSDEPSRTSWRGPYELHATLGAPVIAGAKPLVLISHGHGGSDLGHHDLAVYLASHGFIVATLEHPKDNFHDMSGPSTAAVLGGRPIQVKAMISMLLNDPHWKALIDPNRIGVAGFSAGGYTALMAVGAVPRFDRFIAFCDQHPDNNEQHCPQINRMQANGTAKPTLAALQQGIRRWGNTDDPRIKAAFVMAPFGMFFDKAGLASIDRPVFLYYGQDDPVMIPQYNVLHIEPLIGTLVGIRMIPKAGHYVFLSPCSARLAKNAPAICKDPPGVDRNAAHRQINADALAFFDCTLHVPMP